MELTPDRREKTGARFSGAVMFHARERSIAAVERIASCISPGMTTQEACGAPEHVLQYSDGYRAAVSMGEIDPGFGDKTALVAYEVNDTGLGANGVARSSFPGGVRQGRFVSNLIAVEVFIAPGSVP